MLLAIDPGTDTGWALIDSARRLHACGLGTPPDVDVTSVIIERPVVYPRSKARPNDVVTLALKAGEWAGIYRGRAHVAFVTPFEWKGNVPKDIHHSRIWARLDVKETRAVDLGVKGLAASKRHNVLDAVGLGLWAVQRG